MADESISVDIFDDYDIVVNDFCSWEILDPYHDSDSDDFSLSDEDRDPAVDVNTEIKVTPQYYGSPSSDVSVVSQSPHHRNLFVDEFMPPPVTEDPILKAFDSFPPPVVSVVSKPPMQFEEIAVDDVIPKPDEKNIRIGDSSGAVTYVDSEEDDDNDLFDDELVPFGYSDRFGKQRIRKSGKKGYGRKKSSKKLPHYSTRPGCVNGKHGLGVQHLIV